MPFNVSNNTDFNVHTSGIFTPSYVGFEEKVDSIQSAKDVNNIQAVRNYPIVLEAPNFEEATNFLFQSSSLNKFRNEDPKILKSDPQALLKSHYTNNLEAYAKANNLSLEDAAKLQFAFYNPEQAGNLTLSNPNSPPISEILSTLTAQTMSALQTLGVDVSSLKPDASDFNLNVSDFYAIAFENAVKNDPSLSNAEKGALIFMFYNKEAATTATPEQLAKLKNFQNGALASTEKQYQLPAGWQPALNTSIYFGGMQGSFGINLKIALNNYASEKKLSPDDKKNISYALQNADDSNISPDIKAHAMAIMSIAIADTKMQYDLPINWHPSPEKLNKILDVTNKDPSAAPIILARELLTKTIKNVSLFMPDGPDKDSTFDLISIISKAIIELQSSLQNMQMTNSDVARRECTGKIEMQIHKNKLMAEQKKKADKAAKKQKALGILMKIFKPLMKIVTLMVLMGVLGPILGAVAFGLFIHYDVESKIMKGITEGVSKLADLCVGKKGGAAAERTRHGLNVLFLLIASPAMIQMITMMGGGIMDAIPQMLSDGGILSHLGQSFGLTETQAIYFTMAFTIAITVTTAIATFILNPGSAAGKTAKAVQEGLQTTGESIGKAANSAVKSLESSLKVFDRISTAFKLSASFAKHVKDLEKFLGPVLKQLQAFSKKVERVLKKFLDFIEKSIEKSRFLKKIIDAVQKEVSKDMANGRGLMWIGVLQSLLGAANNLTSAASSFIQADLIRTKTRLDAQITEIEAMMKILKKTLEALIEGLGDIGEMRKQLNMLHDSMLTGMSQVTTQLTSH